jgi:hypothetical protein
MAAAGGDGFGRQLAAYRNTLMSQRTALDAAIAGLNQALAAMGSPVGTTAAYTRSARGTPGAVAAPRRRGRPLKAGSLRNYITGVLRNQPGGMQVKAIAEAVKRAGYKSTSRSFGNQVSAALAAMRSDVQKLGRGQFRLK